MSNSHLLASHVVSYFQNHDNHFTQCVFDILLPLIFKPLRPLHTLFYAFFSQLMELKIPLNNKRINTHNKME